MPSRGQDKAWLGFVAWCRSRRLSPLPAHPWTVAAYARWCENRLRFAAVVDQVRAISRAHLLNCCPAPDNHPTVTRTLRLIEARERAESSRSALFRDVDFSAPSGRDAANEHDPRVAGKARAGSRMRSRAMPASPRLVSRRPPNLR